MRGAVARGTALKLVPPALAKVTAPVKPGPSIGARIKGHLEELQENVQAVGKLAVWIAVPCVLVLTALTMLFRSSLVRSASSRNSLKASSAFCVSARYILQPASVHTVVVHRRADMRAKR